ncbi:hypothetical protein [Phenylobacterium sp.]|uniref:hypothetical protein n=1 Tax=Phenylobacterium sp. TaxID=1871053 RepID=UPI002F41F2D8
MLAALMSQQVSARQESPGDGQAQGASGPPPSPPPGPPPGGESRASSQFAGDTLSSLLDAQAKPPSASDMAGKLIGAIDANGDGQVSLAEITQALSGGGADSTSSSSSSSSSSSLSDAFGKLDTNGDGALSSNELASALQSFRGAHHHHHGGGARPAQQTASVTA